MTDIRQRLPSLLALLALLPALLYAWIGSYGRFLGDDFCYTVWGREMGAWGFMLFMRNKWQASYSQTFLAGALASLDMLAARIMPAVIMAIWLACACWLARQALDMLGAQLPRRTTALALAALLVTAAVHALDFGISVMWLVTSVRYTLPIALLTGSLALALHSVRRYRGDGASALRIAAVSLCFFVTGGFAEAFALFQLTFLSLGLLAAAVLLRGHARMVAWIALGAAWLGSFASAAIQYFAPGTASRDAVLQTGLAVRSLQPLVLETLRGLFDFMARPELPVSLLLLMALGALLASFSARLPCHAAAQARPAAHLILRAGTLWALLALQLVWLPILWAHTSDDMQVFSRFSLRYTAVIVLNIGGLLVLCLAIWRRKRLQAWLRGRPPGVAQLQSLCLACAIFVVLINIPPLPIARLAAAYLFTSVGGLLLVVMGLAAAAGGVHPALRLSWLALAVWVGAWLCATPVIALSVYAFGGVLLRAAGVGFVFVAASGLFWGAALGCGMRSYAAGAGDAWLRRARAIALAVALLMAGLVLARQLTMLGQYRAFAAQWDANHSHILAMRAAGEAHIVIEPVPHSPRKPLDGCTAAYYGVESVTLRGE